LTDRYKARSHGLNTAACIKPDINPHDNNFDTDGKYVVDDDDDIDDDDEVASNDKDIDSVLSILLDIKYSY